ncbi:hypothetical protein B296_00023996 [Ensete ventricosum]|uniref:Uncharacterized protein n=1 Tax=Ensete ventricosum TaxID=4639 RepID=A0A427A6C1_ENSVE|nr:hypothetical protein B296_00023996 [Ensete ventricosum]
MTVSTQRMEKVQHQSHIDFLVQLQRLQIKELVVNEDPNLPSLLTEFSEVFAESKGLPPTRLHYDRKLMKDDDKIITPLMTSLVRRRLCRKRHCLCVASPRVGTWPTNGLPMVGLPMGTFAYRRYLCGKVAPP